MSYSCQQPHSDCHNNPIQSWNIYILLSDFLKTRSDIEGFNSNTFSNYENRLTMNTYNIYSKENDTKIGVMSSHQTLIQVDTIYTNLLTNNVINLFEQLYIPNHNSGYMTKVNGQNNSNPYQNVDTIFPVRSITQDMYGHKVIILKLEDDPNNFGQLNWKIELYGNDI